MDNEFTYGDLGRWPPHRGLLVGDDVRITSGPLANLTGRILKLNDQRCVVRLDGFQNGLLLVISAANLEVAVIPAGVSHHGQVR